MPRRLIYSALLLAVTASAQVPTMSYPANAFSSGAFVGKPYTAREISEQTEVLADGTHITDPPKVARRYRDAQGRTRYERPFARPETHMVVVQITDPLAGYAYVLDPNQHLIHRVALRPLPVRTAVGTPVPPRSVPGVQVTTEPLGTQVIDGVRVQGTRITRTVAAGVQHNDRPLTTVMDEWFSPEYHLNFSTHATDPMRGILAAHMEDFTPGDPDPALFQLPVGYTIVDETGPFNVPFSVERP